jgi:predicted ATP-grasp superfamily ATP-dependent carboligase
MVSDDVGTQLNIPSLALEEHSSINSAHITNYDVLILDAYLRQALVSIRSLGRRGLRIAALDSNSAVPAFSSRWCQHGFVCSASEATDEYLDYLEQLIELTGVQVLIPSSDSSVALLRQYRKRLEKRVRIALAKEMALVLAVNKKQTLEIANSLGFSVPHGILVRSIDEVKEALREVGLPAVVKPIESWVWQENAEKNDPGGKRITSQLVTTAAEAKLAVEELTALGGATLFQQFLTGRREAISFLYANGVMHARFAQWAKRTEPPLGGQSVLRQSIAIPVDIGDQAERLVREIDLEGYSEVEYRRDSAGKPYLMEINPRLSASVEIAVRSGVDFPYLLYQWAIGDQIDQVQSYHVGNWMRYLKGDIMTTIEAIQQRGRPGVTPPVQSILDFCSSFFVPMRYDYFDLKDFKPAFIATRDFTSQWMGGAVRKRLANLQRKTRRQ